MASNDALQPSQMAIPILTQTFPGQVITFDQASPYDELVKKPWTETCWDQAAAYVQLNTPEQVTQALSIITKEKCPFAIRTSGHTSNKGFSSGGKGVIVLDVGPLKSRELSDEGIAKVGAGNTWGEVYKWLQEHDLSAIGGRQAEVGVSGFLLGGGLPAFPNLYGTGADNVVALANGTLVNANINENPDLYRSLKGGSSNFGIVTRFDTKTHPLIKLQWTAKIYNPDDIDNIINAAVQVQEAMEKDDKIAFLLNFNNGVIVAFLLYADWSSDLDAAFDPLLKLSSLITTAIPKGRGTLLDFTGVFVEREGVSRRYISSASTPVTTQGYRNIFDIREQAKKSLPSEANLHYTLQPFGSAGVAIGRRNGGNSLGLQEIPQSWWVFACEWNEAAHDSEVDEAVDFMAKEVQQLDFIAMTFAGKRQNVLKGYGPDNFKLLQQAATKYDPAGVFQNLQKGGFLLRNSL